MNEQHIMYIDDLVSKPHNSFPVGTDFLAVLDRYVPLYNNVSKFRAIEALEVC